MVKVPEYPKGDSAEQIAALMEMPMEELTALAAFFAEKPSARAKITPILQGRLGVLAAEKIADRIDRASASSTRWAKVASGIAVVALLTSLAAWFLAPIKVYAPPSTPPPAASPASPSVP